MYIYIYIYIYIVVIVLFYVFRLAAYAAFWQSGNCESVSEYISFWGVWGGGVRGHELWAGSVRATWRQNAEVAIA